MEVKSKKEQLMKLTKKQKLQLKDKGYEPCVRHLNLYPEDFYRLKTWVEVRECLGIDDCDEVVLSVSGVKTKENIESETRNS